MIGKPFIQILRLQTSIVDLRDNRRFCVVLPCHNESEAKVALEALNQFIIQLKEHIDKVEESN